MKRNNNIENQFKKKLDQRSIDPSEKAWDRLDAMLSVSEKRQPNRAWLWMAASLLVLVTIGSLFFKTNSETVIISNDNNLVVEENHSQENLTYNILKTETEIDIISEENPIVSKKELNRKVVFNDTFPLRKPNQNIEEVVFTEKGKSNQIQKSNRYISAESLLTSVENEKKSEFKKFESKVKIDANSLLTETENEMDESFRNKALNELKNQYQTIKTAVSNRNSQ